MFPVLFSHGSIHFYTYGFSLFVALMAIYFLARRAVAGSILSHDNIDDLMLIIISSLWLGGGLVHLTLSALSGKTDWRGLFDLATMQQFSVFPVALAATLGMAVWCRWKRIPFVGVLDFLIPFLTLGYGLHRILGCFNAGCCYGLPTTLPWGVVFSPNPFLSDTPTGIRLHPTQIYLGLSAWLTGWSIHHFRNDLRDSGARTAVGLAGLSGSYFLIAFLRGDYSHHPGDHGFDMPRILPLIVCLAAVAWLVKLRHGRQGNRI
ncbi:MAG: prolipoprotein diacylglyceryl transferase [Magnetococcales bacterium]|nr:prolipoprotein diacylglyceryl transferase [Magnetococcales bacterium]